MGYANNKLDCASHLTQPLDPEQLPAIVRRTKQEIIASKIEYDAIAFKGMSGALVATIVAYQLRKPMVFVRSDNKCHSCQKVEGLYLPKSGGRYIIIDDFIFSGDTMRTIRRELHKQYTSARAHYVDPDTELFKPTCKGIFLYLESNTGLFAPGKDFCLTRDEEGNDLTVEPEYAPIYAFRL